MMSSYVDDVSKYVTDFYLALTSSTTPFSSFTLNPPTAVSNEMTTLTSLVNLTTPKVDNTDDYFNDYFTDDYYNDYFTDDTDDIITEMYEQFEWFAYIPVCVFGIMGNVLSLWVWNAETAFNPSIFLFQILAVYDLAFVSFVMVDILARLQGWHSVKLGHVINAGTVIAQTGSINMTCLSGAIRLLAVLKPLHMNVILSRSRVSALCVVIMLWTLALSSLEVAWRVCMLADGAERCSGLFDAVDYYRTQYIYDYLAFCVPSIILFLCNSLLVYKVIRQAHKMASTSSSTSGKREETTRRLTHTMIIVSTTTLLTYPVAVTFRLAMNPEHQDFDTCDEVCYRTIAYCIALLQYFNSSVNVVYYVMVSRFRELFGSRVRRLLA